MKKLLDHLEGGFDGMLQKTEAKMMEGGMIPADLELFVWSLIAVLKGKVTSTKFPRFPDATHDVYSEILAGVKSMTEKERNRIYELFAAHSSSFLS